jgi:hypothetical protein
MVKGKWIYPLISLVPLIGLSIYLTSTENVTSQTTSKTSTGDDTMSKRSLGKMDDKDIKYFLTLSSGYKVVPIYDRKGTLEAGKYSIGWGHNAIPINGSLINIPPNQTDLFSRVILIEVSQGETKIYQKYLTTDLNGTYHTSFFPPASGTIKISAMLAGDNSTQSIITVIVTESFIPITLISGLIAAAIILIIIAKFKFTKYSEKKLTASDEKKFNRIRLGLLIAVSILTIVSYVLLFKFPPFDTAANAAFAAALLAPLAAYLYEVASSGSSGSGSSGSGSSGSGSSGSGSSGSGSSRKSDSKSGAVGNTSLRNIVVPMGSSGSPRIP